jgi:hypothetical protein
MGCCSRTFGFSAKSSLVFFLQKKQIKGKVSVLSFLAKVVSYGLGLFKVKLTLPGILFPSILPTILLSQRNSYFLCYSITVGIKSFICPSMKYKGKDTFFFGFVRSLYYFLKHRLYAGFLHHSTLNYVRLS